MENKIKAILDSNMHFSGLELINFNQSKVIADIVNLIHEEKSKVISECNNYDPNNTYEHPHNMQHD